MHLGGNASDLAGKNTTCLCGKLGKNLWVLVADLLKWKVETLGGHRLVVLTEVNPALDGLRLRHDKKIVVVKGLSKLAVESTTVEERIEFHLLKTARSTEALLVASAGVTGGRFAFGLGLSAFQNNNVAWHNLGKSEIGTRKL